MKRKSRPLLAGLLALLLIVSPVPMALAEEPVVGEFEANSGPDTIDIRSDWLGSVFGDVGSQDRVDHKDNKNYFGIKELEDGKVRLSVTENSGKIAGTSEGIVYYYKPVDPDADYILSATAHVDAWNANNQVSFGLMLRNKVLVNTYSGSADTNGDYIAAGALDQRMKGFYRKQGTSIQKNNMDFDTAVAPSAGETFDIRIKKSGDQYVLQVGDDFHVIHNDGTMNYAGLFVSRNTTVTFSNVKLTMKPTAEQGDWQFRAFGGNTSNAKNPVPIKNDVQSITMAATGGKIAGKDEGMSFFYKELPAAGNFEISAKAKVVSFNSDSGITTPNQKSFGLMIRAAVGLAYDSAAFSSNYVAVGGIDTSFVKGFYRMGDAELNKLHTFSNANAPAPDEVYDFRIKKVGDVYEVAVNGDSRPIHAGSLSGDKLFAGLYVARDAVVTFSDYVITTDGRVPTELIVDDSSMDKTVLVDQPINLDGVVVKSVTDDGTEILLPHEYIVTGYDSSQSGPMTITFHYNGLSESVDFMVLPLEVDAIEIVYLPVKTEYYLGDVFDPLGLTVRAYYNTGAIQELTPDKYQIRIEDAVEAGGSYTFDQAGSVQVNIQSTESPEKSTSFRVTVKDSSFIGLRIAKPPKKTQYYLGDTLELDGIVVYARYRDGADTTEVRLLRNEFTVSSLDSTVTGTRTIIVFYKGSYATFFVHVKEKEVAGIEITQYPKTTYATGEPFDQAGLEVSIAYDNGERDVLDPARYEVITDGYDMNTPGQYNIDIVPEATAGATPIVLQVTVREPGEHLWQFTRFGQSISPTKNTWTILNEDQPLNERVIGLEALKDGNSGKITGDHDGITFYYTELDANEDNFELSADIKVNYYAKTPHDGQESFGIMARDAIGTLNDSSVFASNIVAVGGFAGRTTNPNGTQLFARTGVTTPDGTGSEGLTLRMLQQQLPTAANTYPAKEYRLTLAKTNSGFVGKLNNDKEEMLFLPDILNVQNDRMYVGFYTAREASIEVSNIEFKVTAAKTDAPRVNPPAEPITPHLEILSPDRTSLTNYRLAYRANVDGFISVKKGHEVIWSNIAVEAGRTAGVSTTIAENDRTPFSLVFIPDDAQYLTSYDMIVRNFTVDNKIYGGGTADIIVSPLGTSSGQGTSDDPLDIDTAIDYVKPGQKIVVEGGTYTRTTPLRISKYNDGEQDAMKVLEAAPGTRPIFDFSRRSEGMLHEGNFWRVSGLDFTRSSANSKGYHLAGNNNIIEYSRFYDNGDSGFQMSVIDPSLALPLYKAFWPSNNLIQYSVAYDNMDPAQNNADGFAIKLTAGEGNILRGLAAHNNVDDGYDLYTKVGSGPIGAVIVEDSIAFNNGVLLSGGGGSGDKNGFKMGGEGVHVPHIVRNSLAFGNGAYGITSNSNPGLIIEDSIAYNNASGNLQMSTYDPAKEDFRINGMVSYQNVFTGSAYRDRYPGRLDSATNYFYDGNVSRNKDGAILYDSQFTIAEPTLPIDPYDLPGLVNQRDDQGNIVWGDFFKYILPGNLSAVTDIAVTAEASSITAKGGTLQMIASVMPEHAADRTVTWAVYNADYTVTDIAFISSDGLLTAVKDGTVIVVAFANDGSGVRGEQWITISGQEMPGQGTLVSKIEVTLKRPLDDPTVWQMTALVYPEEATNKTVTWAVYNLDDSVTDLAVITQDGLLTVLGEGSVKVIAAANDGSGVKGSQVFHLKIFEPEILVTSIHVSAEAARITTKDGTLQMTATVEPDNASNKTVTWAVYNEDYTSTDKALISLTGMLTALKDGKVKVVAAANDGSGVKGEMIITISGQTTGSGGSGGSGPIPSLPRPARTTEPTAPNQQMIGEEDFKFASGRAVVELGKGKTQAVIPIGIIQGIATLLEVRIQGVSLVVPPAVLRELLSLLGENTDGATIIIQAEIVAEDQQPPHGSSFKRSSLVYKLNLAAVDKDGREMKLDAFAEPVELILPYDDTGTDADLLGVYVYDEKAEDWVYIGGQADTDRKTVTAFAPHFSLYAVMEYTKVFSDVPTAHWAYRTLQVMAAKHIVTGVSATEFNPSGNATRAEFVTMLVNALGLKAGDTTTPFTDVHPGNWFAKSVAASYSAGLIAGVSADEFAPNAPITREQMASLLIRAYEYVNGKTAPPADRISGLSDGASISNWAKADVNKAISLGLMQGRSETIFAPAANSQRAETAQAILNLIRQFNR